MREYLNFTHNGIECAVILRYGPLMPTYWCGYARIPDGHEWYGRHYDDIPCDVHGGLTYGHTGLGDVDPHGYWIGFDCAHFGDSPEEQDQDFAEAQCRLMADQIEAASVNEPTSEAAE